MAGGSKAKQAREKAKDQQKKMKAKAREEREKAKAKMQEKKQQQKKLNLIQKKQQELHIQQQHLYMQYSSADNTFVPSPVYTGSDSTCDSLLKRMERKRDAVTVSRALQELNCYAFPSTDKNDTSDQKMEEQQQSLRNNKPEQVATLANLLYLYKSKLAHDNHYTVRAQALYILSAASKSVPKAWKKFLLSISQSSHDDGEEVIGNVLGWIFVSTCDPMTDVKKSARALWDDILQLKLTTITHDYTDVEVPVTSIVWDHLASILQVSTRPYKLNQAFFNTKKGDKEEMEERYERVVLTTLRAMTNLLSSTTNNNNYKHNNSDQTAQTGKITTNNIHLAFRYMTAYRASFRRSAYTLISTMCSAVFLQSSSDDYDLVENDMARLFKELRPYLLKALTFEKDPLNFPALLELYLFYVSSLRKHKKDVWNFHDTTKISQEEKESMSSNHKEGNGNKDDETIEDEGNDSDVTINIYEFIQGLNQSICVACYGCPADQWTPTILPLLASLPEEKIDLQSQLLESLWQSRSATTSSIDGAHIAAAAGECASFLLLRRRQLSKNSINEIKMEEENEKNHTRKISQYFFEPMSYFLLDDRSNNNKRLTNKTAATLARDLAKLDLASSQQQQSQPSIQSYFSNEQTWFWENISSLFVSNDKMKDPMSHTAYMYKFNMFVCQYMKQMDEKIVAPNGNDIDENKISKTQSSKLATILKETFHSILSNIGTKLPNYETSSLFLSILKFCGVVNIFSESNDHDETVIKKIERFCMNDLLRWIILRTSIASSASNDTDQAVETDFLLLSECILSFELSRRKRLWECVLKEIIKAMCDFRKLSLGLSTIINTCEVNSAENFFSCNETLDKFATEIVNAIVAKELRGDVNGDNRLKVATQFETMIHKASKSSILFLLQTCLGLSEKSKGNVLISPSVITHWIQIICHNQSIEVNSDHNVPLFQDNVEEEEENIEVLLDVLLKLASKRINPLISLDEALLLATFAWRRGGNIWYISTLDMLFGENHTPSKSSGESAEIINSLIMSASSTIQNEVKQLHHTHSDVDLDSYVWSQRAGRLLQLCSVINDIDHAHGINLSIVGLSNIDVWKHSLKSMNHTKEDDKLFFSLIYLLQNIKDDEKRRQFVGLENEYSQLLPWVFISLVHCNNFSSGWSSRMSIRCDTLLNLLGGIDKCPNNFVEVCCDRIVEIIDTSMKSKVDEEITFITISRGIVALDWLLGVKFGDKKEDFENTTAFVVDDIDPKDVNKGDSLWYVTDPRDINAERLPAQVEKVHTDDFPNLYFTVRIEKKNGDKKYVERQTVASRLKRQQFSSQTVSSNGSQDTEDSFRKLIETKIVDDLIRPYTSTLATERKIPQKIKFASELLNIVISRCGLHGKRGLGSLRYDVYQMISTIGNHVKIRLDQSIIDDDTTFLMRCISIALGFGHLTAPNENCSYLEFDPSTILASVTNLFLNDGVDNDTNLNFDSTFRESILMFLKISATSTSEEHSTQLMELIHKVATKTLNEFFSSKTTESTLLPLSNLSMKVINIAQTSMDRFARSGSILSCLDAEQNNISTILKCFVNLWTNDPYEIISLGKYVDNTEKNANEYKEEQSWYPSFNEFIVRNIKEPKNNFVEAISKNSNLICQSLYSETKRWFGFQLMNLLAKSADKFCTDEDPDISTNTINLLNKWTIGLDLDQTEELEEDISVSARWLPQRIMNQIESWKEFPVMHDETAVEEKSMARMLEWLICLDFLEQSAAVDMRNRSHLSSYIEKTGSIGEVFEVALKYAKLGNDKDSSSWISCIELENKELFTLSNVCTYVVYRSFEVLPTMVKTWWTDYCPRSMQNILSQFVQLRIAPEALRRELVRINNATNLGEMSVNGSCVSREVTATYIQDECQLSVVIKIPQAFPLRNVEVDCKKTLGIGEKQWRHWSLQIMRMLNKDDGSVLDALMLWKQNVEKEFEGVEPCPICYSVLCVKSHAMPNLECKTCKNRFHSTCLYKWFHSSGKNQCPLCQEPWSGTRVS